MRNKKFVDAADRRLYKQLLAVALVFPAGIVSAAALLFFVGAIANGIHGNTSEFLKMLGTSIPLGVLAVTLWRLVCLKEE